jgi:hypothetical protein
MPNFNRIYNIGSLLFLEKEIEDTFVRVIVHKKDRIVDFREMVREDGKFVEVPFTILTFDELKEVYYRAKNWIEEDDAK